MTAHFRASGNGNLVGEGLAMNCAYGKSGMIDASVKAEGDGASPVGLWAMKRVFWRPDRLARPQTGLTTVPLRPHDGWCDAKGVGCGW